MKSGRAPSFPHLYIRNFRCVIQQFRRNQSKTLDCSSKVNCANGRPIVKKQEQKGTQRKTSWGEKKDFWVEIHCLWANAITCLVKKGDMTLWQRFGSLASRFREETVSFHPHWSSSCWKAKSEVQARTQEGKRQAQKKVIRMRWWFSFEQLVRSFRVSGCAVS